MEYYLRPCFLRQIQNRSTLTLNLQSSSPSAIKATLTTPPGANQNRENERTKGSIPTHKKSRASHFRGLFPPRQNPRQHACAQKKKIHLSNLTPRSAHIHKHLQDKRRAPKGLALPLSLASNCHGGCDPVGAMSPSAAAIDARSDGTYEGGLTGHRRTLLLCVTIQNRVRKHSNHRYRVHKLQQR